MLPEFLFADELAERATTFERQSDTVVVDVQQLVQGYRSAARTARTNLAAAVAESQEAIRQADARLRQ